MATASALAWSLAAAATSAETDAATADSIDGASTAAAGVDAEVTSSLRDRLLLPASASSYVILSGGK